MRVTCDLCGDEVGVSASEALDHLRLMHLAVESVVERWPDGSPVVLDLTMFTDGPDD